MKLCVASVCSADSFQYYIPTFIYTLKRAYPDYYVKVFLKGKLSPKCRKILKSLDNQDWSIIEGFRVSYPNRESICNTLRHLLPPDEFTEFTHLYITDVDFLIFNHPAKSLGMYFATKLNATKLPYASVKGPKNRPSRPEINKIGWRGPFTRIADGQLMLKIPEWWNKTAKARKIYNRIVKSGKHDAIDRHPSCSYREYNEVMLYRICKASNLKTPTKRKKFLDGTKIRLLYRDIHLGDFKFHNRNYKYGWIAPENFLNFYNLEKEETWQKLLEAIGESGQTLRMIKKCRRYIRKYHNEAMRRYTGKER